jgi:WD40 repeat protein
MIHTTRRIASVIALLVLATAVSAADFRTWSDASGKFTLKAKFVSVTDGKVTLEQEDGTQTEIELAKLSPADQKYVNDQKAVGDNPFKKKAADSPFKPQSKSASGAEPAVTTIDWSGVKVVDITPAESTWKLSLNAAAAGELKPAVVRLPPKTDFFEKPTGLAISLPAKKAVIGYATNKPGKNDGGSTRIVLVDLAAGKVVTTATSPGQFAPLALTDDGKRIIVRRDDFAGDKKDRIEVWTLDGSSVRKLARWIPYDDAQHGDREVKWAGLLADGRLATCSGGGRIAVWDLDSPKPAFQLTVKGGTIPALSPDRKLIAFAEDKEVGVLDPATGQVLVTRDMTATPFAALAFSPDGKRLACVGMNKLYVWDTATGDLQKEMEFPHVHVGGRVAFTSPDYVLVGGGTLLDLERQVRLWDYPGGETATAAGGVTWFVAAEGGERSPGGLVGVKLPQETVLARLKKAMAEPDFFVLKPGTMVAIDVTGLADRDRQDDVATALKRKLETAGFEVGPAGKITLKASTELSKEREVSYHMFGTPRFADKKYKVTEYRSKLEFDYQGKPAWTASVNNLPFFIHLDRGESIEQYLKKNEKSNYDWFAKVDLPKLLMKPTGVGSMGGLGTSRVTAGGLR